jgi:hypothetical protein
MPKPGSAATFLPKQACLSIYMLPQLLPEYHASIIET